MPVIGLLWRGIVGSLLSLVAAAQANPGSKVPAPDWQAWLQGEPLVVGTEAAPACTVFSFHTKAKDAAMFAADGDYLADLQKRFGERGLAVVAVVADAKPAGMERWPGCRIVADRDLATTTAWFTDGEWPWNVVAVDRSGDVVFLGSAEAGLVDAIDAALAGRDVLAGERNAFALRQDLPLSFDDATAAVVEPLTEIVAHAPRDGLALGLLYLAQSTKANDAEAAGKVLKQAIASLANEARPLAAFTDLALRGDPRRPGLAATLKPAMHPAAAAAPNDVLVQLAFLRTLVATGDAREVGRQAMRMRRSVTATAASCLEFATILTTDQNAPVHRDLATMALDRAQALGAEPRLLAAARYGVAVRCAADTDAGKRLLEDYLKDTGMRVAINNDCWYFMTQLGTMGRYDVFAAGLAERMLEQKEAMDYFEFDTAALAMFLVGRTAEAVSLQELAIEKGGKSNPEYSERLQRYKAALAPAPR